MQTGITLGLVTKDRPSYLRRLLSRVVRDQSEHLMEVIVYDNSIGSETEKVTKEFDVTYLRGIKMQPGGRNAILKRTTTEIVCFMDDDCLPRKKYFDFLWEDFYCNSSEKIGCVGGPATPTFPDGRPAVRTHSGCGYNRVLGNGRTLLEQDHSQCWTPDHICDVDFVPGGNMAFRTSILISIGGFDETYGWGTAFHEETDPQLTLREHGFRILYDPRLRVDHYSAPLGGVRSNKSFPQSFLSRYHNGRNHIYLIRKHNLLSFVYLAKWWRSLFHLYAGMSASDHPVTNITDTLKCGSTSRLNAILGNQLAFILQHSMNIVPLVVGQVVELTRPSEPRPLQMNTS